MKFFLEENDHELPNARWVSTVIHGHPNEDLEDNHMSLMVMQFGQFLGLVYHFLKYRISANKVWGLENNTHLNSFFCLIKSSDIVFIFLPAFYLIMWPMTHQRIFLRIDILKI